jgi:PII-like signaling protein
MKGYQLTFFTQQDRKHGREPLAEWLLLTARRLGIEGATIIPASEGYGHGGRIHSAHFFELADQPQEIVMAATEEDVSRLFDTLQREGVHLSYMKTPIEFGVIGAP